MNVVDITAMTAQPGRRVARRLREAGTQLTLCGAGVSRALSVRAVDQALDALIDNALKFGAGTRST